ncbi:hypothetical protein [Paenibacillus guangzhouensis]|uniref:hypothetical protein n=1 Tax=Paenibacillus guangzhouensis TaxID=1473112 RepID=UPI00126690CE|nr:hypothetical protein [Paenibacillus guangzhouensis]
MTYKITDCGNNCSFLLRIHKPVTEGLLGIQHTLEGLESEKALLQELGRNRMLGVQMPVANRFVEYVLGCYLEDKNATIYATLLEWIDGYHSSERNLKGFA